MNSEKLTFDWSAFIFGPVVFFNRSLMVLGLATSFGEFLFVNLTLIFKSMSMMKAGLWLFAYHLFQGFIQSWLERSDSKMADEEDMARWKCLAIGFLVQLAVIAPQLWIINHSVNDAMKMIDSMGIGE